MGNCMYDSRTRAQLNYNLTKFESTIKALKLTDSDAQQLFDFFHKVDEDGSGQVSLLEFFDYLDLKRTKFAKRAFGLFDDDNSGEIDFREFVVALWSYCTYDKNALTMFAFDLYDLDASGQIDMGEMQAIVKEVYGNNFRTSVYAQRIMEKIHKLGGDNGTGEVSREQFNSFAKKHPALLFPAFQMQHALQKRIMGIKFWDSAARKRNKNFGSAMNLQDFLREINEAAFDEMVGHVAGADDYAVTAAHAHNPRAAGVRGAPRTMSSRDLRSVGRKRSSREVLPPGMVLEHPPRRPKKIASTPSMGKKRHPKAQAGARRYDAPQVSSRSHRSSSKRHR